MLAQNSALDILLRGSRPKNAPSGRIWNRIKVERRILGPGAREEEQSDFHYVLLWQGEPTIAEREYRIGRFQRVVKRPGTLSLGSAGRLPAVRALTPYDVTACVIDAAAAQSVLEEMEAARSYRLHEQLGIDDQPLANLMALLALEADADGADGSLYRESIEQALIARFLAVARTEGRVFEKVSPLPHHSLRRILDKLADEYETDLSLADLARESGYSRSHFVKMFRAATGSTPFEHLRNIRLEETRRALIETDEDITAIALRVGFSSHSHLTRLFTRKYGISPSSYRRR